MKIFLKKTKKQNDTNQKSESVCTLFYFVVERLPWPDPEQKAELTVAYCGDAALSYPLSRVKSVCASLDPSIAGRAESVNKVAV